MQLENHVQAIKEELAAAASLGDEATAEAARRMGEALAASLHLHLLDLLGEAALELGARSSRRGSRCDSPVATRSSSSSPTRHPTRGSSESARSTRGRITLRLPESLKAGVEAAAARDGVSTNAWLVRMLARTLEQRPSRKSRNRMQGYVQG